MNNITESELVKFLLLKLRAEKKVTLNEFKRAVKAGFKLTEDDLSISSTRPNERMYEQRCRNLYCHKSFPTDLIKYENQVFILIE
jgi:hypothetical protein